MLLTQDICRIIHQDLRAAICFSLARSLQPILQALKHHHEGNPIYKGDESTPCEIPRQMALLTSASKVPCELSYPYHERYKMPNKLEHSLRHVAPNP